MDLDTVEWPNNLVLRINCGLQMRKNPKDLNSNQLMQPLLTRLEQIMSSVAEMTLPEINRKIYLSAAGHIYK